MDTFFTINKLPDRSCWVAKETVGGAMLTPLTSPDDDLAKVRFSKEVFEILKKKKKKGETVRQCIERIILAAAG